jgi:epoxide hydrolase
MNVSRFRVQVPDEVPADLRERLRRTRWPDEVEGAGWDYGVPLEYMKHLVEYRPLR